MRPRDHFARLTAAALIAATAACGGDEEPGQEPDAVTGDVREATLFAVGEWERTLPEATGFVEVATTGDGTTVDLTVNGLEPDHEYTAHLHRTGCISDPPGGDHWMADPALGESASNEIHLSLTTDPSGEGTASVDSDLIADDRAVAIVVHTTADTESDSDRVLCGDLGLN